MMMLRRVGVLLVVLMCWQTGAAGDDNSLPATDQPNAALLYDEKASVSLQDLQAAAEKVEINGSEYTLETDLWRDFMPISPPDGKPLAAVVKVKAPGVTAISSKIDATRLWVVNGKEIWETELTNEGKSTAGDALERVGRNGPTWGPGIHVDVVVNVVDLMSGENYLLKASNQNIYRTD